MLGRIVRAYVTVGRTFGAWIPPILTFVLFAFLRLVVTLGWCLDPIFFPALRRTQVRSPIVLVGNPRTGTTFLQRFLTDHGVGAGLELWRMLYSSLTIQALIKPILPFLEKVSPARHHSTVAHETSLTSVETDDVSFLFRFFDGMFLYGFILAFDEQDRVDLVDPRQRDTSRRDGDWLESLWKRSLVAHGADRVVAKLFSLSAWLPTFLRRFPDAKILYMVRDPLEVLPSALSLTSGVLDKALGFWNRPDHLKRRYIERMVAGYTLLLRRFHDDYTSGAIPKENVYIVRYDRLMREFDVVMDEILAFTGTPKSEALAAAIRSQAEKQRGYQSKHSYSLEKFGLDADAIRRDCAFVYETFGL